MGKSERASWRKECSYKLIKRSTAEMRKGQMAEAVSRLIFIGMCIRAMVENTSHSENTLG